MRKCPGRERDRGAPPQVIERLPLVLRLAYLRTVLTYGLARGAATSSARRIDERSPESWEFAGFSQNGEDGVIDVLLHHLRRRDRYFVEIGAGNGRENNTTWLAVARRYSGLMVEGDRTIARLLDDLRHFTLGLDVLHLMVTPENVRSVLDRCVVREPDVLSVDVDGNDYHIVRALLEAGLRPRIVVVEYNSAFGPDASVSVPYRPPSTPAHELHYGVSVGAWRAYLGRSGYTFVTVEGNGVNAVFADPSAFDPEFLGQLRRVPFRENFLQRKRFQSTWEAQFALIRDLELVQV